MQYIFLSHDVDWRFEGPSKEHILARKDRFANEYQNLLETENLYYNFPEIMDIENDLGVKSTFFFRTIYENGNYLDYENEISSLIKGGWEIALHLDPSSVNNFEKIKDEKIKLEKLTKTKILGNRVHYLKHDKKLFEKLNTLDFLYDSSIKHSKEEIVQKDMGFSKKNGIYEFPITWMDAYLFTYMQISENNLINMFQDTLNFSKSLGEDNFLTLLWHDNVLRMKGGRMYRDILEFLVSQDDVKVLRGLDIVNMLK